LPTLASVTPATTYTEEVEEPAADEPESSLSDAPATTYIEEVEEPAADEPESSLSDAPATTYIEEVAEPAADEPESSLSDAPATTYIEEVEEPAADEPESSLSYAPATTYIEEVAEPAAEDDVSSPIAPATETTATHRILDSPSEAVRPAILRTLWTGAESWRKIDTRRTAVNRALLVGTALSGFVATLVTYQ
jgi:hypothetical protein